MCRVVLEYLYGISQHAWTWAKVYGEAMSQWPRPRPAVLQSQSATEGGTRPERRTVADRPTKTKTHTHTHTHAHAHTHTHTRTLPSPTLHQCRQSANASTRSFFALLTKCGGMSVPRGMRWWVRASYGFHPPYLRWLWCTPRYPILPMTTWFV